MENKQVQWEVQTADCWAGFKDQWGTPQLPGGVQAPLEMKRGLLSSIGLFIGTGLLGFWFGVGAALGSKMVSSLEELISRQ